MRLSRRSLASLEALSIHELQTTAASLERRGEPLQPFARVFTRVADQRAGGYASSRARWDLTDAVKAGGDELAEQIAVAKAPFWRYVRHALRSAKMVG